MKLPRLRFFWRVYLHGLLLLVLVGAGTLAIQAAVGPPMEFRNSARMVAFLAEHLEDVRSNPARLAHDLAELRVIANLEVAVFDGGRAVASNVVPPPAPLGAGDEARLAGGVFEMHLPQSFAAPLGNQPGRYIIVKRPVPALLQRAAVVIGAMLVALVIASIPMARALASPLEKLGSAARALGSGDLSARTGLRRNDEVGDLALAFDEAAEKIERLIRSEKELLANVSHELRTPITRIRLALDILAEDQVGEAAAFVRAITADLSELERLVDDILTAARLDLVASRATGGELPLRVARIDPAELLRSAVARFGSAHPDRSLDLEIEEPLPSMRGDAGLLRRVLANLLDNAEKYSDASTPITVRAASRSGALGVDIQDRGIGVEARDLPRLFTPFFRTDRSRARGTGGVGLGLTLSRRIVEAHGGRIAVESAPGAGTTFRLEIPLEAAGRTPAPRQGNDREPVEL
jgi:signal transduction histidine kinase